MKNKILVAAAVVIAGGIGVGAGASIADNPRELIELPNEGWVHIGIEGARWNDVRVRCVADQMVLITENQGYYGQGGAALSPSKICEDWYKSLLTD